MYDIDNINDFGVDKGFLNIRMEVALNKEKILQNWAVRKLRTKFIKSTVKN